ncbi:hypothetical protein [Streptomyces sp. NPDC007369]|uniref:hypothetical protein n=1 Tax=Streptomyces sp. NPDC007369 TaxID=3154589 RepID=UPI0033CFA5BC
MRFEAEMADLGAEARTVSGGLTCCLVFDRTLLVLPLQDTEGGALLVCSPEMVAFVAETFDLLWATGEYIGKPREKAFISARPAAPAGTDPQDCLADVAASGEATARVPGQQIDEEPADPIRSEIEQVASWLAEAEETGTRLSGAEVARRLGVSPKTGQRRVLDAQKHLEEQRRQQGPAHLRSVGSCSRERRSPPVTTVQA